MQPFRKQALALLAAALAIPTAYEAVGGERPLMVDDILKLSDVGRGAAQPGSDRFVWEQSPRYDTLSDYGAGTAAAWQGNDYEIFTIAPTSTLPERLFQPYKATTYRLGSFSGDGRFLTLLATRDGTVRVAAYDFQRGRLREFPLAPRFPPGASNPDWAWLDNRHLAIAAYPDGRGPWQFTFRRAIGARLTESWAKSWRGKEASVDDYDSSATDAVRPLAGRLIVLDLVSGYIQQLASGQFSGLRASPDRRWLAAVRQSMLPQSALEQPHLDWTYARSTLTVFSMVRVPVERDVAPELDVLPDSIVWNHSSKSFAFFASSASAGLRSGHFWIFDPSNSVADLAPHNGLSLASQRARGGPQWPERAVWFNDSLAVFARTTPGLAGTLAFEDIDRNGVVDSRVEVTSVPPHWFLLTPNSTPRDLTLGMGRVSPIPVFENGSQFVVVGDGEAWELNEFAPPKRLFPWFSQRLDTLASRDMNQRRVNGGEGLWPVAGAPGSLAQIDLNHGLPILRLLTTSRGTTILAVSKSGLALSEVGVGKGAELALMGPGSEPKMLGKLNPFLDQIAETRWTDFSYSNTQGSTRLQLSGCLLLPSDYHPGRKYPLIVEVYPDRSGGCGAPEARNEFAMAAQPTAYSEHLLAARGFIVFRPDTGGGISRSADGPQAALPAIVDRGVDAVLSAGYGDSTRVGLMGVSQGGFASLWVASQSQRYRAVVSLNGWSDLANEFFEMNWSRELMPTEIPNDGDAARYLTPAGTDFYMGGTPWKHPQRYIANSPLWHSDTVSAPILLIHSDMDEFDDANYKLFFTSLHVQKKTARLLIYRGEGHTPSSPANIRHMWHNIFAWFDKYLMIDRDSNGKMILGE